MNWKNFEKDPPTESGYYLFEIWVNSVNQYGSSSEYKVEYFRSDEPSIRWFPWSRTEERWYPVVEYDTEGRLTEYHKVTWWCEIEDSPRTDGVYEIPKDIQEKKDD